MEKKKTGRKPKPAHLKVQMIPAYLTLEEKELILNEFGSVTKAIKSEILSPIYKKKRQFDALVELTNME
jgi:hypothetical protein